MFNRVLWLVVISFLLVQFLVAQDANEQPKPPDQRQTEEPKPPERRMPRRRPTPPEQKAPEQPKPIEQPPIEQPKTSEQPKPVVNEPTGTEEGVSMNLVNTKLGLLLDYLAKLEEKPLLYDDRFPKDSQINIISPRGVNIPTDKLINVIETILRMKGYTIITTGPVIKLIALGEAKDQITVINKPEDIDKLDWMDRIVTQIIPLKSANANNMVALLNQIKSPQGNIIFHPDSNSIIITEFAANIKKLNEVIKQLDIEAPPYEVITKTLKYATIASVIASVNGYIGGVLNPPGQPQTSNRIFRKPFITGDDRSNSIIIFAVADDMKRLIQVIDTLDAEFSRQESKIYTYKLANSNAADVAPILELIFRPQINALPASAKKPQLTITADKNTNALMIMAIPEMYVEIEKVIRDLDIMKSQVLIEAAIVELDMEKMVQLGIELADVTTPKEKPTVFGGTNFGLSNQTTDGKIPVPNQGLTIGIWKQTVGNIPALLQASQTDTGIDVKAAPRLLTNDNEKASINIEEQVPYDSSTIGPNGEVTAVTFGGYQKAGVLLEITPHISEHNYLRLELKQTVGEFVASAYSTTRPSINTREAKTVVTVPDKETVIIGGLTKDKKITTITKIPLLGDIPILGFLFQSKKDQTTKNNLCIFITPRIIKQFSELTEETNKYKKTVEPQK